MSDAKTGLRRNLSLHPLTFDEALANLLAVKPAAKGTRSRQKPKAARRKDRKGSKRKKK